jgi:hypothetical protein
LRVYLGLFGLLLVGSLLWAGLFVLVFNSGLRVLGLRVYLGLRVSSGSVYAPCAFWV